MRNGRRAAGLVAAFAAALCGPAAAAGEPPNLAEAMLVAKASLDEDGFFLKDGAEAAGALERQWEAVRGWAAGWLRAHGAAGPRTAAAALKAATGFDVQVLRLDGRSLLFAVVDDARGDAFILRRDAGGRVVTAWALEAPGEPQAAAFPAVQAWSPSRAGAGCRAGRPSAEWARCGPVTADALSLPPDASGAARFVLRGVYAQEAGATQMQLVSAWRWDGRAAQPLLAHPFGFEADQAQPLVQVRGDRLLIGSKESWRQLFACGACEGRQARTEAQLTAAAPAWGPTRSLTPELDTVDALYDAVVHGRPTRMASPAAAVAARADVARIRAVAPLKPGGYRDDVLGMLNGWKLSAAGASRSLCLDTDALGARRFTLAPAGPGWRVVAEASAPEGACDGPGARS